MCAHVCETHHDSGVPAGADGRGGKGVEGGTGVELFGAEVVGAVAQAAADGAALIPANGDKDSMSVTSDL